MYSTRLNNNRYIVKCIALANTTKVLEFIVDTGARYTCCNYLNINSRLKEEDFQNSESKIFGGIVVGYGIKFYKFHTSQFTVGSIDMGARDIWITFEDMATDDVLGLDILQDVVFYQDVKNKRLVFCNNLEEIVG